MSSFLETLLKWPRPFISGTDLHHVLDRSDDSRQAILKRGVQKGWLEPIRRDLYHIKKSNALVDTFELAALIYGPSYISFESALSYHGWIPEAVRTTTSASVKRAKVFPTPVGLFSYEHIPIEIFSYGVEPRPQDKWTLLIASPVKALADMIYVRKRHWESLEDLTADLRIEPESFQNKDIDLMNELIDCYPSPRVKKTLKAISAGFRL